MKNMKNVSLVLVLAGAIFLTLDSPVNAGKKSSSSFFNRSRKTQTASAPAPVSVPAPAPGATVDETQEGLPALPRMPGVERYDIRKKIPEVPGGPKLPGGPNKGYITGAPKNIQMPPSVPKVPSAPKQPASPSKKQYY